ncbi:hypothetical protein [Morganella morganii]|uniref:hypothetical protein n=1 Tax=Morganella morganii TaxID=582 RepID=UPI003EBBBF06
MTDKEYDPYYASDGSVKCESLRDMFAAKAMQGLLSNDQCKPFGMSASATDIAKKSYLMADEMLRVREK